MLSVLLFFVTAFIVIVIKADIVPVDQELQTQIPRGARWIKQMRQIQVGSELESVEGSKSCSALSSCAYRKES